MRLLFVFSVSPWWLVAGDWVGQAREFLGYSEPRATVYIQVLIDASPESVASGAVFEETVGPIAAYVARSPGSLVRIWAQGTSMDRTRLVGQVNVVGSASTVPRVRAAHERQETDRVRAALLALRDDATRPGSDGSPIASSIAWVAHATNTPSSMRKVLVIVSDLLEFSDLGRFDPCRPLPSPSSWAAVLRHQKVFLPGSLSGWDVVFTQFRPVPTGRRCVVSLSFYSALRSCWQTAIAGAGPRSVHWFTNAVTVDDLSRILGVDDRAASVEVFSAAWWRQLLGR